MAKQVYKVRYTDRVSGKSHTIGYASAQRAKEAVDFAATLTADSNTTAQYIGSEAL